MSTAKRQDDADYSSTEVSIETMFADAVKALRGDTYTLGPNTKSDTAVLLPDGFDKRPTTAPDIAFNLPNQPFLIAQINTIQLETTLENPEPHFILTQSQYRLIMDASRSFHTFFIIYCEIRWVRVEHLLYTEDYCFLEQIKPSALSGLLGTP